jgi:hypothetical protein
MASSQDYFTLLFKNKQRRARLKSLLVKIPEMVEHSGNEN